MSTAPEMAVDAEATTEIELEAVEKIGHAHAHGSRESEAAPMVRARRHAILLADVEASHAPRPR